MASALTSPFHGLPISETVPAAADMTELKQASILQGRRRVRIQPQTGVSATPNSILQFVLSDSTGLIDCNSMILSGTVSVEADDQPAASAINLLDEGGSIFRRVQVLFNGSLVDDVDNAHRACNMEVLASAESDWYKHDGSFANFWKFNETLSVDAPTAQNDVVSHATEMTLDLSGNAYQVGWPLGLLAPSLRTNKYLPLRNMGRICPCAA